MSFKRARCAHCRGKLVQERPSQIVHVECAEGWALALIAKRDREEAKRVKAQQKAEKIATRARLADMEPLRKIMADADRAFAAYIRERDRQAGHACISSGRPLDWSGNQVDGGHFRSRGAASHLRYNEDNCHAQSKHDNQYKAGNISAYRVGLIERIGLARVEALEADNGTHKWTREELIQIKETYRRKLRELKANHD